MKNAAVNMGEHLFLQDPAFKSFVYGPRTQGLMAVPFLSFGDTSVLLSTAAAPFYFPAAAHKGPKFSTSSPTLTAFCF